MTETTETLYLTTPELRAGDVVLNHGMRILIDQPIDSYPDPHSGRNVFHTPGLITNLPEVLAAGYIPAGWITDGRWNVQGNELARWSVQR